MKDYFIYNGTPSTDFNAYIYDTNGFDTPTRTYEEYNVAGRNGTFTISGTEKFENRDLEYGMYIDGDMQTNIKRLESFLYSSMGYLRLEDTINTDIYRKAIISGEISMDYKTPTEVSFKIKFSCLPELWLKSGETKREYSANGSITNPTMFKSKPLIRVYGYGTLEIGSETITISKGATSYIDIDCDIQDCYEGTTNRNNLVSLTDFPTLQSGDTGIKLGTGITKVEITPRWWTI